MSLNDQHTIFMSEKNICHVFNRGIEKRDIFLKDVDRVRFIHDIYEFNDTAPAVQFSRIGPANQQKRREREKLVAIYNFCLMPNHYHLLCEEIEEGGISLFIKKIQSGYARAFNEKYSRSGHLFQGKHRRILIASDRQLFQVACYIHANPLKLWKFNWKESRLTGKEIEQALNFLENYRWSSHMDYLGKKNFYSVIDDKFLKDIFIEYGGYEKCFRNWLECFEKNFKEVQAILDVGHSTTNMMKNA